MDFGLFMMPLHAPKRSCADAYDRDIVLLVQADRLGYHEVWIGEQVVFQKWKSTDIRREVV